MAVMMSSGGRNVVPTGARLPIGQLLLTVPDGNYTHARTYANTPPHTHDQSVYGLVVEMEAAQASPSADAPQAPTFGAYAAQNMWSADGSNTNPTGTGTHTYTHQQARAHTHAHTCTHMHTHAHTGGSGSTTTAPGAAGTGDGAPTPTFGSGSALAPTSADPVDHASDGALGAG